MDRLTETFSLKNSAIRRALLIGAAFILGFIVLGVISIRVWEYSNSAAFCTNVCHDVHPEEQVAYQDSYHANVGCTECHLSRGGMLQNLPLKAGHLRHVPEMLLGQYGRPVEWGALRPASESCERCHWPPAFQGDMILEIRRFWPDEDNTEKRTYLVLKIGGGEKDELAVGMGYGIHWHALNTVEYIATDEHRQDIRWVRATLPDGQAVVYNDVTNPLSAEEIAGAEKRVMDCVDCHNRVGHPFPPPEHVIDDALAEGQLSRDLPFVKKEMLALLIPGYPSQEEALMAVESWEVQYRTTYPEAAASYAAEIEQAAEVAKELVTRLVFEKPGITWQSFIDDGGHKEFPGCFRCHDGKHLSPKGESVRLHCNICHSIPVTVDPGGSPPAVPAASLQEPASHLEVNFMADHRFQAGDDCTVCHGEVTFGDDDSSFCAISACHGQPWPSVDLDAAFPHPIELEGKHAEAWCHDCHEGVRKPEYQCANCHEPVMEPHFGQVCEDCHTPEGFGQVDLTGFEHPVPLEGAHATLDCMACHAAGQSLTYECAACHQPPEDHLEGTCDTCHTPQGWVESAASLVAQFPQIPHALDGRDDCLLCHDPAGQIKPAPGSHEDFVNEQCGLCHKVAP
ncbi:MAG: NapC/NirT family cytochrome c [Anaerolineae bacterium]